MTNGTGQAADREIINSILADAESQAKRAIADAELSAAEEMDRAQKAAQDIRNDILTKADDRAKKVRAREIATAKIEAKRTVLRAREEAVSDLFTQIEQQLAAIRKDPTRYAEALKNLAIEGVCGVGEPDMILRLSSSDRSLADGAFLSELRSKAGQSSGVEPKIAVESAGADLGGGCIVASTAGRVVYDNTFPRRLERMRQELRTRIVRELMKDYE